MEVIKNINELRNSIAKRGEQTPKKANRAAVGFVPTLGYLHQGHASLLRKARAECESVVLSIFVNPLQFGPNEDFEQYPRDIERDLRMAEENGVDVVFIPEVKEMYPYYPLLTKVTVSEITSELCGASRPGHFDGVATVVMKLLNIVQPDRAYFGLKDAQQVAVLEQMVNDLNMNVQIVRCPTVREKDGLAMSSRNVYLSEQQRQQAAILSETLLSLEHLLQSDTTFEQLRNRIEDRIRTAPLADIDYVKILSYPSLQNISGDTKVNDFSGEFIVALAVRFGSTRLIDNRIIDLKETLSHV
jgi:pantoate--beta-alanine ligase